MGPSYSFGQVADQRDEAAARAAAEVGVDVPAGGRREQRRGRAEADGAGGEVDSVRVLRPARVGLQPAKRAQRGQVGAVQVAQQVLDGVIDRRRVRLHAHPVRRVQVREVQRGHDGHQARAGGLMTADLHAVTGVALMVGGVHDPRGQPQDALLDLGEHRRVGRDAECWRRRQWWSSRPWLLPAAGRPLTSLSAVAPTLQR